MTRPRLPRPSPILATLATAILLAVVFAYNTLQNATHEDYRNSNFSKFWIAGRMIAAGLNPYDPAQWSAEHARLGVTWNPDYIFLYPLPQAFFLVPLGLLPGAQAFLAWSFLSQAIIAAACALLLALAGVLRRRLLVPLVFFLLFFGPVYLSLQIGSIAVGALAVIVAAILLLERRHDLLAGIVLALLALKPSQGLPLLLLLTLWFVFRRELRPVWGMLIGGLVLLLAGLAYDPHWVGAFLSNSVVVSDRTFGLQSNVFGFADLACGRSGLCVWGLGGSLAVAILALGAYILWRKCRAWSHWQAFSFIIPLGFLTALYLWSYDQLLYVVPVVWIVARLLKGPQPYLRAAVFLVVLDAVAFVALGAQAYTQQDLTSIATTALVLGLFLGLAGRERTPSLAGAVPAQQPS